MHAQQEFGVNDVLSHVIGDMAKAISERPGEGKPEQFVRARSAAAMIVDFMPGDVLEAMLAGHCVMFHELMTDSVHDTLRGELATHRRGTRSNIVAMNKAFHVNLDRLDRCRTRPSDSRADTAERESPAPTVADTSASAPAPVPEASPDNVTPTPPTKPPETPQAAQKAQIPAANLPMATTPPKGVPELRPAEAATRAAAHHGNGGGPPRDAAEQTPNATPPPSASVSSPT